ncbi:MAG: rubrerythrin [Fusobacteriaceae bacterium]
MNYLRGTKTEKNLLASFAGESQAKNKYTLFAQAAREEGYEQIAGIFLETAENEFYHAERFFNFLEGGQVEITATYSAGKVGTTIENLKEAAEGEHEEWQDLYPKFAKEALEEGFPNISGAYTVIAKVEKEHEARYKKLLENIENDIVFKRDSTVDWKCRACGYVHPGLKAPKLCPSCLKQQSQFEIQAKNY